MKNTYFCTVIFESGKTLKPVLKKTEKGINGYVTKMFKKYGDKITIQVDLLNADLNFISYCTYSY